MSFDFPWTCPKVDNLLTAVKNCFDSPVHQLIETLEEVESRAEDVRQANSDMREAAEKQIDALKEDRNEWRSLANKFESDATTAAERIRELERELANAQAYSSELEALVDDLQTQLQMKEQTA